MNHFTISANDEPLEIAQDLAWDAWDEPSTKKRITLAKKAIEISPLCADAYTILGNHSQSSETAIEYYKQAVAAGKKALGSDFCEYKGCFWLAIETRPYMRARAELARAVWKKGKKSESIKHYFALLELNPFDHQGLRYELAPYLLATKRYQELHALLDEYHDDAEATWPYTRVLLEFFEHGKTPQLAELFRDALENNKHIPKYLIKPSTIPKRMPQFITMGGEDQAICYVKENKDLWHSDKRAIAWLKEQMDALVVPLKTSDVQQPPSALDADKNQNFDTSENVTSLALFKRNSVIQDDLLGLSPSEMRNFLYHPFESDAIISWRYPKKTESPFMFLYQKLTSMLEGKGLKATKKGNLPLKICKEIHAQYQSPFSYLRQSSIRTESEFVHLHTVRLVAQKSGLIKKQKGNFTLTQKAIKLQSKNAMGELFHVLLRTYVEKFNWAYWDGYGDCEIIQYSAFFSLYALQLEGSVWRKPSYYAELFLRAFPTALNSFQENEYRFSAREEVSRAFCLRFLERFSYLFGFIEIKEQESEAKGIFLKDYNVKKTPLLQDYILFKITP